MSLLPAEKAEILDGQALQLRGTSLRLKGDLAQATRRSSRPTPSSSRYATAEWPR